MSGEAVRARPDVPRVALAGHVDAAGRVRGHRHLELDPAVRRALPARGDAPADGLRRRGHPVDAAARDVRPELDLLPAGSDRAIAGEALVEPLDDRAVHLVVARAGVVLPVLAESVPAELVEPVAVRRV